MKTRTSSYPIMVKKDQFKERMTYVDLGIYCDV
jgi:hypothetical protein